MATRFELRLPDFELRDGPPITAGVWHAATGQRVVEGECLLEVLAGEVAVELAAPASGILAQRGVETNESLCTGQLLAVIEVP
jgi:pyruvate/2-oxoglutarate dehydrogenase complex dihydrolipoamide acyltransferase (E2) component